MCRPKSEGGKRCAAHMRGSRAVFKEAEVYTGADRKTITVVFKNLREEGKHLPDPTQREVEEYADGQRIRARFDQTLNNRDRTTLVNGWEAAREEKPDGGLFYAWRNLRSETARRLKKAFVATFLTASISAVSACGGNISEPTDPTPPTPSETVSAPARADLGNGIVGSDTVKTDRYGDYVPITLTDDSALMVFDKSKYDEKSLEAFSEEELFEAQKIASKFAIEQGVDSELVYDYSEENAQKWLNEHKDQISDKYYDDISADVLNKKGNVRPALIDSDAGSGSMDDQGQLIDGSWYRGEPDNDGGIRYTEIDAELVSVEYLGADGTPSLSFTYDISTVSPVKVPEKNEDQYPGKYVENRDLDFTYGFEQENGKWVLSGYDNNMDILMDKISD